MYGRRKRWLSVTLERRSGIIYCYRSVRDGERVGKVYVKNRKKDLREGR